MYAGAHCLTVLFGLASRVEIKKTLITACVNRCWQNIELVDSVSAVDGAQKVFFNSLCATTRQALNLNPSGMTKTAESSSWDAKQWPLSCAKNLLIFWGFSNVNVLHFKNDLTSKINKTFKMVFKSSSACNEMSKGCLGWLPIPG